MKFKTEIIRKKIAEENLTIYAAAKQAGMSHYTLYAVLERGTCNGTTLGKLARFAGVKAYELVDV